jgi:hypothetical protein
VFVNLLDETTAARDSFSGLQVITVLIALAVLWPLQARLRRTISERRKARWEADDSGEQAPRDDLG